MISSGDISKQEIDAVENFTSDFEFSGKPPSQRLRGVLYRVWEQGKQEYDFAIWYEAQLEKIINKYKSTLDA